MVDGGILYHGVSMVDGGDGLQMCRVTANILKKKKQSRTAEMG